MNPQVGSLRKKTSFYLPLLLLPGDKRSAMEVLYRFCWEADDISDGTDPLPVKRKKLAVFKKDLKNCLAGKVPKPSFQKFQETVARHGLSPEPLLRVVSGVETDLRPVQFKTFQELHQYALKVAGGPGLASMEIFGYKDFAHRVYAENLGVFLQLVNMTRDYLEDTGMKRRYFPLEDFKRFHIHPSMIGENNSHWAAFVQFQLDRAWSFLEKAREALTLRQRGDLKTAEAIAAVYVKLFQKLRNHPQKILQGRVSLSFFDKMLSVLGTIGRCFLFKWL